MPSPAADASTPHSRAMFGANAVLAGLGLVLSLVLVIMDAYPSLNTDPTLIGFNDEGMAGLPGRVFDYLGQFTHLSNLVVALVMLALWRNPSRGSRLFRVLRLDSLIMITVTGLVYAVMLAPDAHLRGWEHVSSGLLHYVTPVLTILVFVFWGPRHQVRLASILPALLLPLAWVACALVRGAAVSAYPYAFIDVAKFGYGTVLENLIGIVAIGIVLGFLFWAIEILVAKLTGSDPRQLP